VKGDRAQIGRGRYRLDMPAALAADELDEVAEKVLCEMLSPRGCSDGDRMHISNRFGLRDKAEQISDDTRSFTNDECRVSKLTDEEGVVQVTSIAPIPEFRQALQESDCSPAAYRSIFLLACSWTFHWRRPFGRKATLITQSIYGGAAVAINRSPFYPYRVRRCLRPDSFRSCSKLGAARRQHYRTAVIRGGHHRQMARHAQGDRATPCARRSCLTPRQAAMSITGRPPKLWPPRSQSSLLRSRTLGRALLAFRASRHSTLSLASGTQLRQPIWPRSPRRATRPATERRDRMRSRSCQNRNRRSVYHNSGQRAPTADPKHADNAGSRRVHIGNLQNQCGLRSGTTARRSRMSSKIV
jgi:hypothetical protein